MTQKHLRVPKTFLGGLQNQNYFCSNTRRLFAFLLSFLSSVWWSFPGLYTWTCKRLNAEEIRIQLLPLSDTKKYITMPVFSLNLFVLENRIIFLNMLMCNGFLF